MIKMIAAVSLNSVIGKNNDLPWGKDEFPEDMAYFREKTANSVVVMGKNTFHSMGSRPLPKRTNIVITREQNLHEKVICMSSLKEAIEKYPDCWLIGGSRIYAEGLNYADEIHVSHIPKMIEGDSLTYFPYINASLFSVDRVVELNLEKDLRCVVYGVTNK